MYTYTNSLEINLMVKDKQLKKFRDENLKLRIDANRD